MGAYVRNERALAHDVRALRWCHSRAASPSDRANRLRRISSFHVAAWAVVHFVIALTSIVRAQLDVVTGDVEQLLGGGQQLHAWGCSTR